MTKLDFKTLMLSGALALGAQNVLASAPLPCPKGSPVNDTIGVLQSDIKSNVQNRLMQIDREKFHQIVVITVNSPEDYGYDLLARMGADTINKCGIGYRGENTGTIIWYSNNFDSDKNKYFISTASGVSGYITDNLANRLVASSKETCEKTNTSCRIDDITKGLDAIISKHLAGNNQVQVIQEGIKAHDAKASSDSMENILELLGLGGLVILVVGGGIKLQNKLMASKKRRELKKKIGEVVVKFEQEKAKYPEWFFASHMSGNEYKLNQLQSQTDEQLDTICRFSSMYHQVNDIDLPKIQQNLESFASQYEEIIEGVENEKKNLFLKITLVRGMYSTFDKEGYQYKKISLDIPEIQSNPEATLKNYLQMSSILKEHIQEISEIPRIYKKYEGFDSKLISNFTKAKNEFEEIIKKYESVFGKSSLIFSLSNFETQINALIAEFQTAYKKKDIPALQKYKIQSEKLISGANNTVLDMSNQVSWYEGLPKEISSLEARLKKMNPSGEYVKNAKAYRQESGKRKFEGYDMGAKILTLFNTISTLKANYDKKVGLSEMKSSLNVVINELDMMQEYIGLGAVVAAIIAQRIAEEQRQAREAERRRKEAEDEAERQRKRDDDAKTGWTSSSTTSATPDWSPGGGTGGDGGGGGGE